MRICWHSNAPWTTTGYGAQTGLFAPRFRAAGHDLVVSAFYGLEGNILGWKGVPVLPSLGGTFGNESLPLHANFHFQGERRSGLVITLMDVWVLDPEMIGKFNVAAWCPVDHDPAPPRVEEFFRASGAIPIAMSRFGEERLAEFDPIYVPHGVDTEAYRPIPKKEARKGRGLPESAFLVGMVAANKGQAPGRKCFVETFAAFAAFADKHKEARLVVHSDFHSQDGVNLAQLAHQFGIGDQLLRTDQYRINYLPLPPDEMAGVYSSFDVLINPSAGEGFGLTPLEAQACGVPVIVTDFSAMSEVCGAGWKVGYTTHYTPAMAYQAQPDVEQLVEVLEQSYSMPAKEREAMQANARSHAEGYDADVVMEDYWKPALTEISERCGLATVEAVAA